MIDKEKTFSRKNNISTKRAINFLSTYISFLIICDKFFVSSFLNSYFLTLHREILNNKTEHSLSGSIDISTLFPILFFVLGEFSCRNLYQNFQQQKNKINTKIIVLICSKFKFCFKTVLIKSLQQ